MTVGRMKSPSHILDDSLTSFVVGETRSDTQVEGTRITVCDVMDDWRKNL